MQSVFLDPAVQQDREPNQDVVAARPSTALGTGGNARPQKTMAEGYRPRPSSSITGTEEDEFTGAEVSSVSNPGGVRIGI